jgi:hypothetical protein
MSSYRGIRSIYLFLDCFDKLKLNNERVYYLLLQIILIACFDKLKLNNERVYYLLLQIILIDCLL